MLKSSKVGRRAAPKEALAVVYLSAAPGPLRWHYRQLINALVYQAMVD
jgi:hypothetical protein